MSITSINNRSVQPPDLQKALDRIYNNFKEAMDIIGQLSGLQKELDKVNDVIKKDQAKIDDLNQQIGKFEIAMAALLAFAAINSWNPAGWAAAAAAAGIAIKIGVLEKQLSDVKNHQQAAKNGYTDLIDKSKALTAKLEALSPSFHPLCNAINRLLDEFNSALHSMSQYLSGESMEQDVKIFNESLQVFVTALTYKAQEIKDQQLISEGDGDIMALAADAIANESREAGLLNDLSSKLTQDVQFYRNKSRDAEYDDHTTRWYEYAYAAGTTYERVQADRAEMQNSKDILRLIADVKGSLLAETASLTPGLEQISAIIHKTIKEIKEILADATLTPDVKQKKIVKLFVIIMSYLSLIQAYATQYKSQQDKEQSEATLDVQKAEVDRAVLNSKMLKKDLEYAHNMKVFMAITEAVVGVAMAAMTVVTAGSTLAIACAVMACLFAAVAVVDLGMTLAGRTGSIEMATEALARQFEKTGGNEEGCKIGAGVLIASLEIAATFGAAAITKVALKSFEKSLTTAIMAALRKMLENLCEQESARLLEALSPMVGRIVEQTQIVAAKQAIRTTVEAAAKAAAEKAFKGFTNKGIAQLVLSLIKTGDPEKLMAKAAEEAAKTAAKESADILISTGRVGELTPVINEQLQAIAARVSSESAARVLNTTAEKITELLEEEVWIPEKKISKAKQVARGVGVGGYAVSSTNLLTEIATAAQKKWKKMSDKNFEYLMIGIQLVQQILQFVAMAAANISSMAAVLKDVSKLSQLQTAGSLLESLSIGVTNGGLVEAHLSQGEAMAAQTANKTASDMMNLILSQINKSAYVQRKFEIDQQAKSAESTYKLSSHLWENGNIIAEILSGRAV